MSQVLLYSFKLRQKIINELMYVIIHSVTLYDEKIFRTLQKVLFDKSFLE